MEQWTGSKLGKEYDKAVYCHPAYLTSMDCITLNAMLDDSQAGIKVAVRNINHLRYADDTTRPPYLSPERPVCRSREGTYNQIWDNELVPNWERSMTRLYIVTLLI